jgi:tetratricopeptide (TPR) repeat protein
LEFHRSRFVARESELKRLEEFCLGRDPGYLLVEALGGFGKTTLLARLIVRLEVARDRVSPFCVFFMIRSEGARNTADAFLKAVNAQLLDVLGLPGGTPPELDQLASQFSELWGLARSAAGADTPLVLVVDGLDDMAAEPSTIVSLLPSGLTDWVHVIVSSRPEPSARENADREHPLRSAEVLELGPFGEQSTSLVLEHYGVPQEQARALAPRVVTVTGGEPLFVRFVCEEVGHDGEAALLRIEADPPHDVEDYFRQQLHGLDNMRLGDVSWDLLGLLAVARGGLRPEEMADALGKRLHEVKTALRPVERYLLPSNAREFFHRTFRELVAGEFTDAELSGYRVQIVDWCRRYAERDWPPETPAYILAEYAEHLANQGDQRALITLCDRHWFRRHLEATGSPYGFLRDAELALEASRSLADGMGDEIHLCLLIATVASVATRSPPSAIGVLARLGEFRQAYGYSNTALPAGRIRAFTEIAKAHSDAGNDKAAHDALDQAIRALMETELDLEDLSVVADAAGVAGYIGGLEQLLGLVRAIHDQSEEMDHLERARRMVPVLSALAAAGDYQRAQQLARTALQDDVEELAEVPLRASLAAIAGSIRSLQACEESANSAPTEWHRVLAFAAVAQAAAHLGDPREAARLGEQTVEIVSDLQDVTQLRLACQAVELLSDPSFAQHRESLMRRAFEIGRHLGDFGLFAYHPGAIETTAGVVTFEEVREATAALQGGSDKENSLSVLAALCALLGRPAEARSLVDGIPLGDGSFRNGAVESVVACLSSVGLLDDALSLAGQAPGSESRAVALGVVAGHLFEAGLTDRAGSVARQAIAESERPGDLPSKAAAFAAISCASREVGDPATAESAAEDAYTTLTTELPARRTPEATGQVVQALLGVGRVDESRALALEESTWKGSVGPHGGSPGRSDVLAHVAHAYISIDRSDAARELTELAADVATSDRDYDRVASEMAAARAFHELGEVDRAAALVERMRAAVEATPPDADLGRPGSVAHVATALKHWGRDDEAMDLARDAAERLRTRGWLDDVDVAESLAEVGLSDEAMILAREAAERRLRERFLLALDDVAFTRSVALLPPAERPDALLRLRKLASETSMPWQCITLSIVGAALHRLGRPEGLACTREALRLSRQALRWVLLSILQEDATVVADLDRGKTLRRVHQSLREIDQWWVDPAES